MGWEFLVNTRHVMSWEFLGDTRHVARKPHRCIWCGEPIEAGTEYIRQCGKYDGDFQANEYHPGCFAAMETDGEGEFVPFVNMRQREVAG
jgi:hypothetical protein